MSGRLGNAWRVGVASADLKLTLPLVLFALAVIVPALGWGIPHVNHPARLYAWGNDDQVPMASLAEMQNSIYGSPPNRNYAYPLGQHLVWSAFYAPVLGFELASGGMKAPSADFPFGFEDPVGSFERLAWVGRGVNVAMAIIALLAMYATGRMMGSRAGALVSALGLLFAWPFLYFARTGNPDAATMMWTCLGLSATAWILRDGYHRIPGVMLGICIAAASASKEQALGSFFLVVPTLLGLALLTRSERALRARAIDVLWSGVAFAVTFVVWQGIWLDPDRFMRHMELLVLAGAGGVGGPGYLRHLPGAEGRWLQAVDLFYQTVDAMTWPWLLVSLAGVAFAAVRARRQLILVLSAIGFFYMLMLVGFSRIHYVLAIAAVLLLFAGHLLGRGIEGPRSRWPVLAATVLLFVVPVLRAVDLTHDMRNDGRYAAGEFLRAQVQPGDRVLYFGAIIKLPRFPDGVDFIQVEYPPDARPTLLAQQPEWIAMVPEDTDEFRQRVNWRSGPHSVHSAYLPESLYRELDEGVAGYRLVGQFQSPRLLPRLARPFLTYPSVNPPVQLFLRDDRAGSLPRLEAWTTAPHNPPVGRINEPAPVRKVEDAG